MIAAFQVAEHEDTSVTESIATRATIISASWRNAQPERCSGRPTARWLEASETPHTAPASRRRAAGIDVDMKARPSGRVAGATGGPPRGSAEDHRVLGPAPQTHSAGRAAS